MSDPPQPTERDLENAARRQAISERQAAEHGRVLRLAGGYFGNGWIPSGRHFLVEHEEEERARRALTLRANVNRTWRPRVSLSFMSAHPLRGYALEA